MAPASATFGGVSRRAASCRWPHPTNSSNSADARASLDLPSHAPISASEPSDPKQLTPEQQGDRLEASHRYQAAIQAYARVEQPSAGLWNRMGIAYQMLYNLKDAMRCYKESLKIDAANANVLNNLGTVQDLLKDFRAAERSYREALKLDPGFALVLRNLGTNLLMQHQYDKSAEAYRQALAANPHIFEPSSAPVTQEAAGNDALGNVNYLKARSCARAGLTDCALAYLERSFLEGFATPKKVAAEADFASLRGTPALARLLAREQ